MESCLVVKTLSEGVVEVRLNRPHARNALNGELMDAIARTFADISGDADTRAIVLCGEGGHFCAGADLRWMANFGDEVDARTDQLARAFLAVLECPKLVVAKVAGSAFAGGLALIAAADVAVARSDAAFSLPEVKIGLAPALTTAALLTKLPAGSVNYLGATGKVVDAHQALRMGLVHEIAQDDDQLARLTDQYAAGARKSAPQAVATFKGLMRRLGESGEWGPGDIARTAFSEGRLSACGREGIAAAVSRSPMPWDR